MSYAPPIEPLTKKESDFAAENHEIVFHFLHWRRLDVDKYYDVVILRYLRICKQYCNEKKLQKWAFSTVAFHAMSSAVYNYHRSLKKEPIVKSLDAECTADGLTFGEMLPDPKADVLQTVINREIIKEYFSERKLKK